MTVREIHSSDGPPGLRRCLTAPVLRTLLVAVPVGMAGLLPSAASLKSHAARATPPAARVVGGGAAVTVSGELRQWHAVTVSLAGPFARERDTAPNPFLDFRLTATFEHESGAPRYLVPGYFAADGRAAETGADAGAVWRAHLSPDKPGRWRYRVSFARGPAIAISGEAGQPMAPFDGATGSFDVAPTDQTGRGFRARGRLHYVGGHHLRFAGSGDYFLKAGPDSPETFLGSADFDGTVARKPDVPLKTWGPHVRDWREGDPIWRGGRGKGLIGTLNYLASQGLNSFSFLPYNAGGDGDNVWPFVDRDDKRHYDCSKLEQWGIVFDHAQRLGLHLHFKLQETENDDQRHRRERAPASVPEALDGGALGPERKLYLRELVARFAHHLALTWNLGEENTQTPEEQRAMARFIADIDPYGHHRVIHTYPDEQERVYEPLLGSGSALTGASLQNEWNAAHARTHRWVTVSSRAGRPWVVANDEQGPANFGVPPDPGYQGFGGVAVAACAGEPCGQGYDLHDVRRYTLWGNLMAGGAGVEYYFGYRLPQNDLVAEDFRSRERTWGFSRIALEFFERQRIPFWAMRNADELVGNPSRDNSRYCLALPGELYLVYLPHGGRTTLDLSGAAGGFEVSWFDPRSGGSLTSAADVHGGAPVALVAPTADDWLAVVRSRPLGASATRFRSLPGGKTPVSAPRDTRAFRFRAVGELSLGLWEGDQPVLVYNHGAIRPAGDGGASGRCCYVHPLYGPDGEVLTDDYPEDHPHQRGLYWAWPSVTVAGREHSLWKLDGIRTEFRRWLAVGFDGDAALLGIEHAWMTGARSVLREEIRLRVHPADAQGRAIDVEARWTPTDGPVRLQGAAEKGYGGLTLRLAPRTETLLTLPEGRASEDTVMTRHAWADLSGRFAGGTGRSGAAVFVHPRHPGFPLQWVNRSYGMLAAGWPGTAARTLAPGETVTARYRLWIHRGAPDATELQRVFDAYGKSVR